MGLAVHACDLVNAYGLILQQEQPEDFGISTDEQHSVREFVTFADAPLGWEIDWLGTGAAGERDRRRYPAGWDCP